jgi:hypothetical protein
VAWKMTIREVDGVSVMEWDRHIVLGEPRSSAERSPCCHNTSECSVIPPESMPSTEITSSNRTSGESSTLEVPKSSLTGIKRTFQDGGTVGDTCEVWFPQIVGRHAASNPYCRIRRQQRFV